MILNRIVQRLMVLTACCLLPAACCGEAAAQSPRYKIEIQYARVGFPPGPSDAADNGMSGNNRDSLYKFGAWTPIYINLTNVGKFNPDPKKDGPAVVVVEALDCDGTTTNYTVPVPAFDEEEGLAGHANVMAYTRTGTQSGDFTIRVIAGNKEIARSLNGPAIGYQNSTSLDANQGLYLALGTRLPELRNIGVREKDPNQNVNNDTGDRKAYTAAMTRVGDMPTLWFGFNAADVVILATSNRDFILGLINDRVRTAALAEWVRRGGRLIVCAGANADVLAGASELNTLLPVEIGKSYTIPTLQLRWADGGPVGEILAHTDATKPLTFTGLMPRDKPARAFRVLTPGPPETPGATPVIVQGPYGLGRVTVLAFDPDKPPAARWAFQSNFWKQLLARSGPHIPESAGANQHVFNYRGSDHAGGAMDNEQSQINGNLEAFEGVPVISFGWVALFILIYILVVGPLDYLFLKKVVKRLEFTWITFPTIVLAVSAAAYFTAYHIKGSDLRINKLDLIDIDHQTGQAYGRTWFTLFSPQIRKYTVGIEPAVPWVSPAGSSDPAVAVTWFGNARMARETLIPQSYDYAARAVGLRGVPINVWTSKGFQADWAAPLDAGKPPLENHLRHPPGRPDDLIGSITSRLPAPLEDTIMIYRGDFANLGTLLPDAPKTVTSQTRVNFSTLRGGQHPEAIADRLQLLFHEAWMASPDTNNGSLRDIDQSWRLSPDNRDEVILVGRLRQAKGLAEEINQGPDTPARLWVDKLPTDGTERPPLRGALRQDTIVRVFLPIAPEPR